jgi:SAM-dependent methyltransferase
MQTLHTLAELDAKIAECDRAGERSEDEMRALLGGFQMAVPHDLPQDPFSPAYREAQLRLYAHVTGHPYAPEHEVTRFDVEAALRRPFPFYTGSNTVAGEYFMAIGFVLQSMALPTGSRILEFGPGWGWTSILLAQLGHQVTVIDIEPCFCDLIRRRAAKEGVDITVINADFFHVETLEERFDAVLFYDCFHHCDDHLRLLTALRDRVTNDGRLYFGAEPIEAGFPCPWGLRLDGWALWGVRKNGWMELGFRDDYFAAALTRTGWFGRRLGIEGQNRQRVWEARRRENVRFTFEAGASGLQSQSGRLRDGVIQVDGAGRGAALYGPYTDLPAGAYVARIDFHPGAARRGGAEMDISANGGEKRLAARRVQESGSAELAFTASEDVTRVEVRLFGDRGFTAQIDRVVITPG